MRVAILSLLLVACSNDKISDEGPRDSGFVLRDADAEPGCAVGSTAAKPVPVDLIFAIDQSESMDGEIALVKKNINRLTDLLGATKLDYQVVMIARPGLDTYGVCIPPPLGAEGCGDNLPRFKRSAQEVLSHDALAIFLATYDSPDPLLNWSKYIRTESLKAFVPVTDDDATQPIPPPYWQSFDREILARGAFGTADERNYAFYPIIGAAIGDPAKKCSTEIVSEGPEYSKLAALTGGSYFSVCSTDYAGLFTAMADAIVGRVMCSMPLPPPPAGETLDLTRVNVRHVSSAGKATDFVKDESKPCSEGANGWQYNKDQTKILLCGDACATARAGGGRVDVIFGCKTRVR